MIADGITQLTEEWDEMRRTRITGTTAYACMPEEYKKGGTCRFKKTGRSTFWSFFVNSTDVPDSSGLSARERGIALQEEHAQLLAAEYPAMMTSWRSDAFCISGDSLDIGLSPDMLDDAHGDAPEWAAELKSYGTARHVELYMDIRAFEDGDDDYACEWTPELETAQHVIDLLEPREQSQILMYFVVEPTLDMVVGSWYQPLMTDEFSAVRHFHREFRRSDLTPRIDALRMRLIEASLLKQEMREKLLAMSEG